MVTKEWCVNIGPEGSGYRITDSKFGVGFSLLVNRGIPCEGHVQAFSAHNSTVMAEEVEYVVNKFSSEYFDSISKFVDFLNSIPQKVREYPSHNLSEEYNLNIDWNTKENLACIFFQSLIKNIVDLAEFYSIKNIKNEDSH